MVADRLELEKLVTGTEPHGGAYRDVASRSLPGAVALGSFTLAIVVT